MDEEEIYEGLGLEAPEDPGPGDGVEPPPGGEGDATPPGDGDGNTAGDEGVEPPAPEAQVETPQEPLAAPAPPAPDLEEARRAAEDEAYRTAFAGRLNPYTGKPITNRAEFEQYQAAVQADQQRQQMEQMRRAGVDPGAIQAIIDRHPVVQQAQQVIQQARAERERAQVTQAKGWYGEQLKAINALDPEAKLGSLDDLAAREPGQYAKMLGMVAGGVSLADAYKALNFDTLARRRAAAAKQAVLNQAAGKGHLAPSAGQGVGGVEVPGDIREMYRDMNPDMTDAQISAAYAAYLKETQ